MIIMILTRSIFSFNSEVFEPVSSDTSALVTLSSKNSLIASECKLESS